MITFFGASVTLQKTGYAKVLSEMLDENVKIFGYGGMHLNNAGICFIDDVLDVAPTYCLVDFFSTVYTIKNEKTKEYIDTIIYKFSQLNCKLIFLFFPKHDSELDSWYDFCQDHLISRNVNFIDVNEKLSTIDKNTFLKDSVHTNNYGSQLYADIIFEEFSNMKNSIYIPKCTYVTDYINIKKLFVEKSFNEELILKGSAKVIGIVNTIGPYTGIVSIKIDDNNSYKENLWDEWCYYTRKHFNLSFSFVSKATITILDDVFDTKSCKYNVDFKNKKKKFIVHEIYYIGNKLEIENLEKSKNILKAQLSLLNFKGRLIQMLSKYIKRLKK